MSKLLKNAYNYINENEMLSPGDRIVVGLSGGADSVCLLLILNGLRRSFGIADDGIIAVHVNHGIRGAEADEDQEFARGLCGSLGIELVICSRNIPEYARTLSCTVEEAGRRYRYQCFEETARTRGCTRIAVAHNKNDMAETVLFNLVRGTGIKGLSGIPAVRGNIIRPLLFASRSEIEEYLAERNQSYRTDSTNLGTDYDRNKIRHVILPEMTKINSAAVEHICRIAWLADENYSYMDSIVKRRLEDIIVHEDEGERLVVYKKELQMEAGPVRRQLIHEIIGRCCGHKKDITGRHVRAVEELLQHQTGKCLELPYGLRVRVSYEQLIFSMEENLRCEYYMKLSGSDKIILPSGDVLEIRFCGREHLGEIPKKRYTKVIDYGKIKDTLCIRNAQEGDYIVIDEQGRKKKMNRLFIDNKIDRQDRNSWPVVAVGSEVVWAVGLRYNESYRIDDNTSQVMCLEYKRKGESNG